jgi:hypothetical protein
MLLIPDGLEDGGSAVVSMRLKDLFFKDIRILQEPE